MAGVVGCPVGTPHDRNFPGAQGTGSLSSMTPTMRQRSRSRAVPLLTAALVALSSGCAAAGTAESGSGAASTGADSPAPQTTSVSAGRVRITMVVGSEDIATATLADSPAARTFAAALPMTFAAEDRFGQAKAGRLPYRLSIDAAGPRIDPAAGGLYYWPPNGTIAVVTTDLGLSIPPGVVPLGSVDTGLDALASAGNRFDMTFERAG
jgi:hypothetical protein